MYATNGYSSRPISLHSVTWPVSLSRLFNTLLYLYIHKPLFASFLLLETLCEAMKLRAHCLNEHRHGARVPFYLLCCGRMKDDVGAHAHVKSALVVLNLSCVRFLGLKRLNHRLWALMRLVFSYQYKLLLIPLPWGSLSLYPLPTLMIYSLSLFCSCWRQTWHPLLDSDLLRYAAKKTQR